MEKRTNWFQRGLMGAVMLILSLGVTFAQEQTLTGVVTGASDGLPIPGVSVVEKGTTNGTITDIDGNYSLTVNKGVIVAFSFVGMTSQEVTVGDQTVINVALDSDAIDVDEVVVTALGIKREKKSLAYSAAEIGNEALAEARESNPMNSLSGRVAGVNVSPSATGEGGSTRVTIRGNSFISGNNQPLIVVDGVPMDNLGTNTDDTWGNRSIDYGNGMSEINPDDIETMSVLKGPAASALYGSRAGNGVILITTKGAVKGKKLGIAFNNNTTFSTPRPYLEMQNEYGQGVLGSFDAASDLSWGEKMTGQSYVDWTGKANSYSARDNDINDFLQNGLSTTSTLDFTSHTDKNSFRASVSYNKTKGTVPTHELEKYTASLKSLTNHSKVISSDFSVRYTKTNGENRPKITRDPDNPFYSYIIMPRSVSYTDLKNNVRDENTLAPMRWHQNNGVILNPYYSTLYNTNEDERHRISGYAKLNFQLTKDFSIYAKYGLDFYSFRNRDQLGTGVPYWFQTGDVRQTQTQASESNFEALAQYKKDQINGSKFSGQISVGTNLMSANSYSTTAQSRGLTVPDFYSINNSGNRTGSEYIYRKKINSVFALAQVSYDNFFYIDLTYRSDWSSTINMDNNPYSYPSIGTSIIFSQLLDMPSWFTFGKIRASYAEVGNDTDPYQLELTNTISDTGNANAPNTEPNPNLKSERLKSTEFGFELKFVNNRVGLDYTYYENNTEDQIIRIPFQTLQFSHKWINAGEIQNKGHEVIFYATPLQTSKFKWDLSLNWSKNKNKIISLHPESKTYVLSDPSSLMQVIAVEGGSFGDLYGYTYMTNDKGQRIMNGEGRYQRSDERVKLGNFNPDWTAGLSNSFTYGDSQIGQFSLGFLFDMQKGGDIYSYTQAQGARYGTSKMSVENGRADYTIEGVTSDNNPVVSTVSAQTYWQDKAGIDSEWIYDASEINFRELTIGYSVPRTFAQKISADQIRLSFVARNLATFGSDLNGLPAASYTTSNSQGVEMYPASRVRTMGFNLSINF
ncbi:SusC/RagA family TonB-linked outer membrane protein [Carboxylicivirga sp. N1Y90]|uniref:SusC/RagA family TonB-linked outer membrane protein n=1 Tax=Carboxylicivirga fragile TaxID=3417571 RepID=UPI003D336878|nr:SusC/RagA family TonB-linked outer membrane protein [Marinilabiliaceae bacterium N1Y90]